MITKKIGEITINGETRELYNKRHECGGAMSWNDLTDKPFYTKQSIVETGNTWGTDGGIQWAVNNDIYITNDAFEIELVVGKKYRVHQYPDYICECKSIQGASCIGNVSIVVEGEEDTKEPFLVIMSPSNKAVIAIDDKAIDEKFFVSEVEVIETVKTLDPIYLPNINNSTTPEIIEISEDSSTGELSSSHTYESIKNMLFAGTPVYAFYDKNLYAVNGIGGFSQVQTFAALPESIIFEFINPIIDVLSVIKIYKNDTLELHQYQLTRYEE